MDRGAWQATVQGITKELGMTEQLSTAHSMYIELYIYLKLTQHCKSTTLQKELVET